MRPNSLKAALFSFGLAASIMGLGSGAAFAAQTINLTTQAASTVLPDGTTVPMWGYFCGAAVAGSTASCAPLNSTAGVNWSPVVITVPTGQDLQINLTNNLSFMPVGGTTANTIPTSLTIVGQLGGGLGNSATYTASPTLDPAAARHLPDRIGHASLDPGADGLVRHSGGDLRADGCVDHDDGGRRLRLSRRGGGDMCGLL
jgi:hypothetical protein